MSITPIQKTQSLRNNYAKLTATTLAGAAIGAGSRYILPTKNELSSIINKDAVDTFVTNASAKARGANRSILKYAGIGALIAVGINMLSKVFHKTKNYAGDYSKLGALIDAPDYAVEIMWYGE